MDEVIGFLDNVGRIGGTPSEVISWMNEIIRLGNDYATNGPARPADSNVDERECVAYASIALKLLVWDLENRWEAEAR